MDQKARRRVHGDVPEGEADYSAFGKVFDGYTCVGEVAILVLRQERQASKVLPYLNRRHGPAIVQYCVPRPRQWPLVRVHAPDREPRASRMSNAQWQ